MLWIIMPGYWMNWIRKFWVIVFDSALHEKTKWRNIFWKNRTHPSCSVAKPWRFNGRKQRNTYLKPVVSALKFLLQVSAVPYHHIHNAEYKLLHDIKVSYQYINYIATMRLCSLGWTNTNRQIADKPMHVSQQWLWWIIKLLQEPPTKHKDLCKIWKKIVHVKDGNLFHPLRWNRCQAQPGGYASKLVIVKELGGYITTPTYTSYQLCLHQWFRLWSFSLYFSY